MIDPGAILGFAAASFAVAISPGPSWVYVLGQTIRNGRLAGFVAILGNALGILAHVIAAALGVSVVLHQSETLFTVLQWLGVLYMVYLAFKTLHEGTALEATPTEVRSEPLVTVLREGFLVNALNPKVSLLMLALMPQFIDPPRENVLLQQLVLGSLHVGIASAVLSIVAIYAETVAAQVRRSRRLTTCLRYVSAGLFLALGASLAMLTSRAL